MAQDDVAQDDGRDDAPEGAQHRDPIPQEALVSAAELGGGPVMRSAVGEWLEATGARLGDDPRFSGLAVDHDQEGVTVWWHGPPSAELAAAVAASPSAHAGVRQTALPPQDLLAARERVLADPAVPWTSLSVPVDCSRLEVTVHPSAGRAADGAVCSPARRPATDRAEVTHEWLHAVGRRVAEVAGVPVEVTVGDVVALPAPG